MSEAEALLHAITEVIERDSLSELLIANGQGRITGRPIVPSFDSELALVKRTVEAYTNEEVRLRELPALAGHCVAASSSRKDKFGRTLIGLGASPQRELAATRALLEYEQECVAEELGLPYSEDSPFIERRYLDSYPFLGRAETLDQLRLTNDMDSAVALDEQSRDLDVIDGLATILRQLEDRGFRALYRVAWSEDADAVVGPIVVHVLIPGAERFHVVRHGVPVEPIGRLRSDRIIEQCRERRWT